MGGGFVWVLLLRGPPHLRALAKVRGRAREWFEVWTNAARRALGGRAGVESAARRRGPRCPAERGARRAGRAGRRGGAAAGPRHALQARGKTGATDHIGDGGAAGRPGSRVAAPHQLGAGAGPKKPERRGQARHRRRPAESGASRARRTAEARGTRGRRRHGPLRCKRGGRQVGLAPRGVRRRPAPAAWQTGAPAAKRAGTDGVGGEPRQKARGHRGAPRRREGERRARARAAGALVAPKGGHTHCNVSSQREGQPAGAARRGPRAAQPKPQRASRRRRRRPRRPRPAGPRRPRGRERRAGWGRAGRARARNPGPARPDQPL
jgi:hypothetical protein